MVLVNAIYFKGDWVEKFDAKITTKQKFYCSDGCSVYVDMMYMKKKFSMDYISELKTKALELPYKGESLSMIILLPDDKDGLANLEANLTADHLANLRLHPHSQNDVKVALPRFKLEESASLKETLSNMGMLEVFSDSKSDLSKMDGTHNLFLSKVVHKTFIEVNEEGSEAAAATAAIVMAQCASMALEFRADHPFLFIVHCNCTRSLLFMGKVESPSSISAPLMGNKILSSLPPPFISKMESPSLRSAPFMDFMDKMESPSSLPAPFMGKMESSSSLPAPEVVISIPPNAFNDDRSVGATATPFRCSYL